MSPGEKGEIAREATSLYDASAVRLRDYDAIIVFIQDGSDDEPRDDVRPFLTDRPTGNGPRINLIHIGPPHLG